jgi:hypothetical protein
VLPGAFYDKLVHAGGRIYRMGGIFKYGEKSY